MKVKCIFNIYFFIKKKLYDNKIYEMFCYLWYLYIIYFMYIKYMCGFKRLLKIYLFKLVLNFIIDIVIYFFDVYV